MPSEYIGTPAWHFAGATLCGSSIFERPVLSGIQVSPRRQKSPDCSLPGARRNNGLLPPGHTDGQANLRHADRETMPMIPVSINQTVPGRGTGFMSPMVSVKSNALVIICGKPTDDPRAFELAIASSV